MASKDRRGASPTWLGRERERRGVLQSRLAHDLGVSQQSLSGYENGRSRVPDDVATRLARAWGLSEADVRRHLGLWVPVVPDAGAPVVDHIWPDNAVRLPKGVRLTDLEPHVQQSLEKIVDAFIDSVTREGR